MFIFFACPKKMNQKKRHFFQGIFSLLAKNHKSLPKFFPRLQKFLTVLAFAPTRSELRSAVY